jgi:hypothetical protein
VGDPCLAEVGEHVDARLTPTVALPAS